MVFTSTSRGSSATTSGATWSTPANAYDGAYGSTPSTYATFAAASGVSGYIQVSGYGFTSSLVPLNSEINFVNVNFRGLVVTANRWSAAVIQAYVGGVAVGTSANINLTTTATQTAVQLTGISAEQVVDSTFSIRATLTRAGGSSDTASVDYLDVSVDYSFENWGSLYL